MPDAHISACLEKNWNVFALLISLIRRLVQSDSFTRQTKHRACHLLRMAEAFARRLLVLRAHALTLAEEAARKSKRAEAAPLQAPSSTGRPACSYLSLAEPLPAFIPLSDTPFPEAAPTEYTDTNLEDIANPAPATRRLAVLEDILLRPAHHARRMARWLKRFATRTRRFTPFCLGSPPGTSAAPKRQGSRPPAARHRLLRPPRPEPGAGVVAPLRNLIEWLTPTRPSWHARNSPFFPISFRPNGRPCHSATASLFRSDLAGQGCNPPDARRP